MKLRIEGQTIRYRLSSDDLMEFKRYGRIEDRVVCGAGQYFVYILEMKEAGDIEFSLQNNSMTAWVSSKEVGIWMDSNQVGVEGTIGGGEETLRIIVEKDLKPKRERDIHAGK